MRTSILIAAHNEGARLWQTVGWCLYTTEGLDREVIVADDASEDDSVAEVESRYPEVKILRQERRKGPSPTKDLAARMARGRVLVFLDGHCKPEGRAIEHLARTVRRLWGRAIVTPKVVHLDCDRWRNDRQWSGYGFRVNLRDFSCQWLERISMKWRRGFYESPTLVGCAFAMSRKLYIRLKGFDPDMADWGIEDLDLGLKSWLMGYPVLNTPYATVGHRFRGTFDNYSVRHDAFVFNQLRMARKNFTDEVWNEWLQRFRAGEPEDVFARAWTMFCETSQSLESERAYLMAHRRRDEYWYAEYFGQEWPRRESHSGSEHHVSGAQA